MITPLTPTPGTAGSTATGPTTGPTTGAAASSELDQDTFLKLMVAQLRNQDPMNPTDSSQFLAQTAQFTSLEKLGQVAERSEQAYAAQMAFGASGMVGKTVSYRDADGAQVTGTVGSVRFGPAGPTLDVNGADVALDRVVTVES